MYAEITGAIREMLPELVPDKFPFVLPPYEQYKV